MSLLVTIVAFLIMLGVLVLTFQHIRQVIKREARYWVELRRINEKRPF